MPGVLEARLRPLYKRYRPSSSNDFQNIYFFSCCGHPLMGTRALCCYRIAPMEPQTCSKKSLADVKCILQIIPRNNTSIPRHALTASYAYLPLFMQDGDGCSGLGFSLPQQPSFCGDVEFDFRRLSLPEIPPAALIENHHREDWSVGKDVATDICHRWVVFGAGCPLLHRGGIVLHFPAFYHSF